MKRLTILTLVSLFSFGITLNAQMSEKKYNFSSFSERDQSITEEMRELIPDSLHDHPEFGSIPYKSPCEDCFELIQKRTDSTKLFVKKDSQGKHYFSQATLGKAHYEENGFLMTYDPRLEKKSSNYYESDKQGTPTFINTDDKNTGFKISNDAFVFNNELELILVQENGNELSKGKADWSNHTVGEEGIKIINAWEGIDIKIKFDLDRIKTNYIIKKQLPYLQDAQYLKFSDNIILPENHQISAGDFEYIDSAGNRFGDYLINDAEGDKIFKIHKGFGYDNSGIKENTRRFHYTLSDRLDLFVPNNWLTSDSLVYPVVIDPLVSSTATFSAGWKSFLYDGAWCGNTGGCTYNLSVPRPPNSTITGTTMDALYESLGGYCLFSCYMNEAGFKVFSPCGESPAAANSFWSCNAPNPGTCSATGLDVFSDLGSCLGSACSGAVDFQIQNSYCYCSLGGACGDNCQWMPNNSWSMTLEGRTLETLGDNTTGSGSTTIIASSCTGTTTLDPNTQYGVPGYSYNWSTGETTPTIDVSNATTGDTYTADVIDACGNTVTATFQISCPLAVTLDDFNTENLDETVAVNWSTASERENDYFQILRSRDGKDFEAIGEVSGAGNSSELISYYFVDKQPLTGISYYKLGIVDIHGDTEYSGISSVNRLSEQSSIVCIPNPAKERVDIVFDFPKNGQYDIHLMSMKGDEVYHSQVDFKQGKQKHSVDVQQFKSGVYKVQIVTENHVHTSKLIIE